jgi:DNA polymerase I-like protein with 3'-5' exonuclease and polymerase domains
MKLDLRKATTVDFETYCIESRPSYPPKPVGVAIRWPSGKTEYLAWAHPAGGNNCKLADAKRVLAKIAEGTGQVLFHNAKFDLCVWAEGLKVKLPSWDRIHDTLPMLFIRDPRAVTYSLKPTAELLLKEPPEERDAVIDWLVQHQPVPGIKLVAKRPKNKQKADSKTRYAGAYVAYAPVSLVGPYAIGDVSRTYDLAQLVGAEVAARGMVPAYRREVDLIEPIMDMERRGVPVDVDALAKDVVVYSNAVSSVDLWLRKRLKVPAGVEVNWDSNKDLVKYMLAAGVATEGSLGLTPSGEVQTNKDALARGVTDPQVLAILKYRSRVVSSLDTFMRPWLATARKSGGRIFTTWYTTRHDEHGARTGRMASSPNLQNMTKKKVTLFEGEAPAWWKALGLPELPFVRRYIIAERGHVLIDRDKSQQEIRIFAHYEDGPLMEAYNKSPWLDLYNEVLPKVNAILGGGVHSKVIDDPDLGTYKAVITPVTRDAIKTTVLAKLYGMGVGLLAMRLKVDVTTAKQISDAVIGAVPGLRGLARMLKETTGKGLPVKTWGGREYFCEPPKMIDGQMRDFHYKMINVLIQASAADDLKECILWFWRHAPRKYKLILTVHDELVVSAPAGEMHKAMALLKKAMNHVKFDVPMLSEGKYGPNMASLVDYDKKGVDVYAGKSA